ncbi:hypothetical protein [Streptomyces ipomoeae]|uniref:hypothetical protein n=1 Tax=Streptomyces ipomoeae TaxID=103232 RepID=UPI001146A96D|nr:hypothetical protein [Streptomyces ipomoeae]TQE33122.1 hypothetical protein Sipo7851_21740 [Streptomyces ipomoeae]
MTPTALALAPTLPVPQSATPQAPRRGRGRPPLLDGPERIEEFLGLVRSGQTVDEAATAMGMRSRTPVYTLRRQNHTFAQALSKAQQLGRQARRQARSSETQMDQHGTESSYVRRRCSCGACTRAASQARTRRRQAHNPTKEVRNP